MGIPKLAAHVQQNCKFNQTNAGRINAVIFDGDGLVWAKGSDAGADFSEVAERVKKVLWGLRDKSEVCFDGFSGEKKERTTWKRQMQKVGMADDAEENRLPVMPLVKRAVKAMLKEINVPVRQSWGEADQEISWYSLQKQALVVGDDSDFLIMAHQYLRLPNLHPNRDTLRPSSKNTIWRQLGLPHQGFLPLLPVLAGNDYISTHTLQAIRQCTAKGASIKAIAQFLSANKTKTVDELIHNIADQASTERAAACGGGGEVKEEFKRTYLRHMYESYDSYCLEKFKVKQPRPGLPKALVESYEDGRVGAELAGLFTEDERPTFWLPVVFEDLAKPSVHSHTRDLRCRVYSIGLSSSKIVREYYSCGEALLHEDIKIQKTDQFPLEPMWEAVGGSEEDVRRVYAYLLPYVTDEMVGILTAKTTPVWLKLGYLVVAVMMQYNGITFDDVYAYFCGVVVCGAMVPVSTKLTTETIETHHMSSLFKTTLHWVLLANDATNGALIPQIPFNVNWIRTKTINWVYRSMTQGRMTIHDIIVHQACLAVCDEAATVLKRCFPKEQHVLRGVRRGKVVTVGGYDPDTMEAVYFTSDSYVGLARGLAKTISKGSAVLVETARDATLLLDHITLPVLCLFDVPSNYHYPAALRANIPQDTIIILRASAWLLSAAECSVQSYTTTHRHIVFFQVDPSEEFLYTTAAPVRVYAQGCVGVHTTLVELER